MPVSQQDFDQILSGIGSPTTEPVQTEVSDQDFNAVLGGIGGPTKAINQGFTPSQPERVSNEVQPTNESVSVLTPEAKAINQGFDPTPRPELKDPITELGNAITEIPGDLMEGVKKLGGRWDDLEAKIEEIEIAQGIDTEAPWTGGPRPRKEGIEPEQGDFVSGMQSIGAIADFTAMSIIDIFDTGMKLVSSENMEELAEEGLGRVMPAIAETELLYGVTVGDAITGTAEWYEEIKRTDPVKARNIAAGGGFAKLVFTLLTAGKIKKGKALVEGGVEAGIVESKMVKQLFQGVEDMKGLVKEIDAGNIPIKEVRRKIKTLPIEEQVTFADNLSSSMNKISPSQLSDFGQMTNGKTPGQWLNERGMTGTRSQNVEKLVEYWQNSMKKVDEALSIPRDKFHSEEFGEAIDSLGLELGKRSKDRPKFMKLKNKYDGDGLTLAEENELKRMYARNVSTSYKADLTKTAKQKKDATDLNDALREGLIDRAEGLGINEIRALNKETQSARFLADSIAGKQIKQAANNTVSLTDNIMLAPAAMNPQFIALYGLKKLLGWERVKALLIKQLNRKSVKPLKTPDLNKIREMESGRFLQREMDPLTTKALPSGEGVVPSAGIVGVKPIRLREEPLKPIIKTGIEGPKIKNKSKTKSKELIKEEKKSIMSPMNKNPSGYNRYKPQADSTMANLREKKKLLLKEIDFQNNKGSEKVVDELMKIRDELDDALISKGKPKKTGIVPKKSTAAVKTTSLARYKKLKAQGINVELVGKQELNVFGSKGSSSSVKTTSFARYKKLKEQGVSVELVSKQELNK